MKKIRTLLLATMIILPLSGQAQIFKKMKERAEKAVERTILNRTDSETAKATDKGIDEVLKGDSNKKTETKRNDSASESNTNNSQNQNDDAKVSAEMNKGLEDKLGSLFGGSNSKEIANVPDSYTFSYRAKMKIKTGNKEEMLMDYYLEPDVTYFGAGFEDNDSKSINVMDVEQNMIVIFMEQNGQKLMMTQKSDPRLTEKFEKASEDLDKEYMANMKDIGGRKILGFNCKGYETSTKEGTYRIWITDETPVGFVGAGLSDDIDIPESLIRMGKNAMTMELQFAPAKGKRGRLHMLCVDFIKEDNTIKKDDYRSMMGF